jgi:DNA-binding XRE family transcriptional regulator
MLLLSLHFLIRIHFMESDISPVVIKKWRKEKKLTQTQLGKRVGLNKFAVTNIEHGKRKISKAEQLLFKLLIRGELPFPVTTKLNELNFTVAEWECISALSKSYLAQIPEQTLPLQLLTPKSSTKYSR